MNSTSATLLGRLFQGDDEAWRQLDRLYTPLIRGWLLRHSITGPDADDLAQEVMAVVLRRIPDFEHNQRTGAFRAWLRIITVNCVRDFWKAKRIRPAAPGGSDFGSYLDQLADSGHPLSREWDREHDVYMMRRLLDMIKAQFEPQTWQAFQRVALEEAPAAQVAQELNISVNAVFIAKSRVLARLRELGAGLIEE